jgi:hypothetical protein
VDSQKLKTTKRMICLVIFLINASASPSGGAIIHLSGFGQADYRAKPDAQNKSSNP